MLALECPLLACAALLPEVVPAGEGYSSKSEQGQTDLPDMLRFSTLAIGPRDSWRLDLIL